MIQRLHVKGVRVQSRVLDACAFANAVLVAPQVRPLVYARVAVYKQKIQPPAKLVRKIDFRNGDVATPFCC